MNSLPRGVCPLHLWPVVPTVLLSGARGWWRRETGGSGDNETPSWLGSLASPCCVIKKEEVLWAPPPLIAPDFCPQPPLKPFTTSGPLHHSKKTQRQEGHLFAFPFLETFLTQLELKHREIRQLDRVHSHIHVLLVTLTWNNLVN